MKRILLILTVFLGIYGFTYATDPLDNKNIVTEITTTTNDGVTNNKDVITDCPDCYGTLQSTYITEYCVGQRCRDRTLYRCNYDSSHEYWIYH